MTDSRKKKLEKTFWNIMYQMYREAEPPLDLKAYKKKLEESDKKSPQDWFMKHYLSEERQQEIIDENTMGLSEREKRDVSKAVFLGFAPSCVGTAEHAGLSVCPCDPRHTTCVMDMPCFGCERYAAWLKEAGCVWGDPCPHQRKTLWNGQDITICVKAPSECRNGVAR